MKMVEKMWLMKRFLPSLLISLSVFFGIMGCSAGSTLVKGSEFTNKILGISVSREDTATKITIVGKRAFTYLSYPESQMADRFWLSLRFIETGLGKFHEVIPIHQGAVTEIIPTQIDFSKKNAELRIGLKHPANYHIVEKRNRLMIIIDDRETPQGSSVEKTVAKPVNGTLSAGKAPTTHSTIVRLDNYIIGLEDVLEVLVWKDEDLSNVVEVRPDGKISLPLIGDVVASGLSPAVLGNEIGERLKEYKKIPRVSVIVREINSFSVYVLGEVTRPGKYQLKRNATVLQVISMAGGFTQYALRNRIKVLRRVNGETLEQTFKIRYEDIVSKGDASQNILLRPDDTIIIP